MCIDSDNFLKEVIQWLPTVFLYMNGVHQLLIDKNMKKKDLRLAIGMSTTALAKQGRNQHVGTEILMKICEVLDCDFSDIIELVKSDSDA